jgi:hypothetical protein
MAQAPRISDRVFSNVARLARIVMWERQLIVQGERFTP